MKTTGQAECSHLGGIPGGFGVPLGGFMVVDICNAQSRVNEVSIYKENPFHMGTL